MFLDYFREFITSRIIVREEFSKFFLRDDLIVFSILLHQSLRI